MNNNQTENEDNNEKLNIDPYEYYSSCPKCKHWDLWSKGKSGYCFQCGWTFETETNQKQDGEYKMELEDYWDFTQPNRPIDYWLEVPNYRPFSGDSSNKERATARAFRILRYFWKRKLNETKKYIVGLRSNKSNSLERGKQ